MTATKLTGVCALVIGVVSVVPATADAQDKPKLVPLENLGWRRAMIQDKCEDTGEVEPGKEAKVWIDKALELRGDAALVPGFRPVVVGNHVLYRNYAHLSFVLLQESKNVDIPRPVPGAIYWKSTPNFGGPAYALYVSAYGSPFRRGVEKLIEEFAAADLPQVFLENTLAGTTSFDGQNAYWVETVTVPPPVGFDQKRFNAWPLATLSEPLKESTLWANDLASGKIVWTLGNADFKDAFFQTHFIGAPFPFKFKLYALNETNKGELRLVVIDPANGKAEGVQLLDTFDGPQRFFVNPRRRVNAATITEHDGLLVCLTHTGKVFGIEAPTFKVRWTHTYQKDPAIDPKKSPLGFWKAFEPFIQEGKVVFTAADDEHIHCVNLKDGQPVWKIKQADDLYVAGLRGAKVLVVGNSACRGLALKDGKELWKAPVGTPSGIGVFDKTTYLVPLKNGSVSKGPQIAHLDVEQGRIVAISPLTEIPGNLALNQDEILSVSATAVTGFRRTKEKTPE